MSAHTPGPWRVINGQITGAAKTARGRSSRTYRTLIGTIEFQPNGSELANAKLIAAVPILFDELGTAVAMARETCDCGQCGGCATADRWEQILEQLRRTI